MNIISKSAVTDCGEILTQKQASDLLGVTVQTLINWRKTGKIPCHEIGGRRFYLHSELISILKAN